ncbi:MAG: lipopolysaccharide core heptose(II) kinase RfaY [Armatimonadota bacterium]
MIRREDLKQLLCKGRGLKADVYLVGAFVVKDYHDRSFLVRHIGRMLVSREKRVYERLSSLKGIPKCYGKLDDYALILERIDGTALSDTDSLPANFGAKLRQLVDAVHSRGVASRDLSSSNIIVFNDQPYLIDFAVAFTAGPLTKPIFGLFKRLDIYGVACLKERYQQGLEKDERRVFSLLWWERSLRQCIKRVRRLCGKPGRCHENG